MKKNYLLLTAALLYSTVASAQNAQLQSFIEKNKNKTGFSYAYLSKSLFDVAIKSDISEKDWAKIGNVVKNIGSLVVLAADSIDNAATLATEVQQIVSKDEYDELLTVRDGADHVRILSKDDGDAISELVLLVSSDDEFVLVTFAGKLELANITQLATLLDAEEVEKLAHTTQAVAVEFQVSPNPGNGLLQFQYADTSDEPALITVINQQGRQIAQRQLSGANLQEIDLQELPAGNYWLQLQTRQGKIGVQQVQIIKR